MEYMRFKRKFGREISLARSAFFVVISALIMAVNIKTFVRAGNLVPGGITGLSLLVQRTLMKFAGIHIPYFLINILLNAIPAAIGFKFISKRFTTFSVLMIVLNSFMVDLIPSYKITTDPLLVAVFGGLINGIAISIALKGRASSGGTDFVAVYLNRKFNIRSWNIILGFNVCILLIAGALFGFEASLYSIIFQFVSTQAINTFNKNDHQITMFIVTNKPDEIEKEIYSQTNHGATRLNAQGSYKHENRTMIYTVISEDELNDMTSKVMAIDPHAFVNVTQSMAVKGNFYQKPL